MKMRIEKGKPLNLNDQLNSISMGLLPEPIIGTPTTCMTRRSRKFQTKLPSPVEYVQMWPTPKANSGNGAGKHGQGGIDLQSAVQLYPTPTEQDFKHRGPNSRQQGLADVVRFPTPTLNGNYNKKGASKNSGDGLETAVKNTEENKNGQLNPDWVERLMGYPLFWTDIDKDSLMQNEFPIAWLDGTWEEGIPRVVFGIKNRVNRLKGLGNSVVPQIPMFLWLLVKEYLCQ